MRARFFGGRQRFSGLGKRWQRALTLVVCMVVAGPMVAGAVDLRVVINGEPSVEPVSATVRIEPAGGLVGDGEAPEPVEVEMTAGESVSLDLFDTRLWAIRASADGYWSPEVFLTPDEAGESITLRLYRTGRLEIPVEPGRFGEVPEQLEARFEPVPGPGSAQSELRSAVDCPVVERTARCDVPAGRLDLRLSAAPWAPSYQLGLLVEPGATVKLDPVELVRGASVSGWVEREDGEPPPEGTIVELAVASGDRAESAPRLDLARDTVEVDERGFFQFRGVRPGWYRLVARADGYAPARLAPVEMRPDLESSLRNPLVLARAVRLSLQIDPATDPWGEPWTVRLSHVSRADDLPLSSVTATAGADGTLFRDEMEPGHYRVALMGSNETHWLREEIDIGRDATHHLLTVPLVEVEGTVTRGGEAVAGTLWFGTRHGERRVVFDVDLDGEFQGLLPSSGEWPVEWLPEEGDEEGVTLRPVEVADERRVELHLEIPNTEVVGEVVDPRGNPVEGAAVRLVGQRSAEASGVSASAKTDDEGRFRLSGMEPGLYGAHANRGTARSTMTSVTVSEDLTGPDLRLVLQEELRITGRVTTGGAGVPGATVMAWPTFGGGSGASIEETVTGPTGEFDFVTSGAPGPWNFLVTAPNRAVHMGLTQVSERDLVELTLDPYAGTLILEELGERSGQLLLVHDGTFLPVLGLVRMIGRGGAARPVGSSWAIQGLEPGEYALCDARAVLGGVATAESCSTGVLAPYGELRLAPPTASPSR